MASSRGRDRGRGRALVAVAQESRTEEQHSGEGTRHSSIGRVLAVISTGKGCSVH